MTKLSKRPRRRRRNKANDYFTKVHEEAIINYALTDDKKIRTELYIKYIGPAFDQLVDKIVYTYKFTTLPNIDYLKDECKIYLTTILDKYDSSKKSKAFSYFSVITKNWFIHKVKKNSKNLKREIHIDDITLNLEEQYLSTDNPYEEDRENYEFWMYLFSVLAPLCTSFATYISILYLY